MHRSVYFASLAALLAGTAVAGPHAAPVRPHVPAKACCDGQVATPRLLASAAVPRARTATAPAAADAESAELDALIATLYATVSGPAGTVRDWSGLARLHAPGARLHVTRAQPDGTLVVDSLDFATFTTLHEARFRDRDFHEREVARETAGFGGVRHVWSTFEARRHPDDPTPYARGVNSLQLARTPEGWRLLSATWDFERADLPLPARVEARAQETAR